MEPLKLVYLCLERFEGRLSPCTKEPQWSRLSKSKKKAIRGGGGGREQKGMELTHTVQMPP